MILEDKNITLNAQESKAFLAAGGESNRFENEKESILEAIRACFDEFEGYTEVRQEALVSEGDFSLSISVKIPDGLNKVVVKITGNVKRVAEAAVYFDDDGQMQLDFDGTESAAREIERNSRR